MKSEKNENQKGNQKQIKLATIIYSILILLGGFLIACVIFIYVLGWNNSFIRKIEKVVLFPAASINNSQFVAANDLNENLDSVKKFYEAQDFSKINVRIDFSTEDGKNRLKIKEKEILNRMIEDKTIGILAARKGIKISKEEVDQNLERKLEEYGHGDDLKENLEKLYGWTIEDFKEKVIKPDMYKQELEKIFLSQDTTAIEAKNQIEKAQEELNKKKNFTDVAKNYSKGSTAQEGGELGWFQKNQLIPDISDTAFSLDKGKRSDILKSALGFHIIEVEDKKTENNIEMVKIRQIFIPTKTFSEFLSEEMKNMKFRIFLKDYFWNQEKLRVEFKNEEMKKTEQEIMKNSQGDASLMF